MNRFDKWLDRTKWTVLPVMYVLICVHTYFGTNVEIEGIALPRPEAGVYGVITLHVIGFLAALGAYLLHWIVELISRLFK